MDKFIGANFTYINEFFSFNSDSAYIIHGTLLLLVSAVLIFLLLILYKKIRRKFPVKVNCWFCNTYTKVPFDLANSWNCPLCQQYNGFTKDGSYNKVIKEQYNSKLNQDIIETLKSSTTRDKSYNVPANGFCKLCNINQQLKIQQLALFVPINESNYYEEIEQYRAKLEKAYQLCSKCEKTLQETLEKQEYNLLQSRLNGHKQKSSLNAAPNFPKLDTKKVLEKSKKMGLMGLHWISMITAALLFIALFTQIETEFKYLYKSLPDLVVLETLRPIFKIFSNIMKDIRFYSKELSFVGFFCSLLCLSERTVKTNQINLLVWGLFHLLLWSDMKEFQILIAGVSLYFNHQSLSKKPIYFNKKPLPKKFGFQPEKQIFPRNLSNEDVAQNVLESPKPSPVKLEPKQVQEKKKKKNEIECLTDEVKESVQVQQESAKPALNSSVFSKSFLSTLEEEKNEEPLDAVYNNLNGLSLGGTKKKSNKPANFLFSSNFSDKRSTSSIIKPAKFVKNLSSSWTELNESASRSSTPSSGYSSQKADKIEFSKTMSPISVNPFSQHSPRGFEYYDGSNGCYNYNTYNCFSPGFVPFQQFPGPMGHTTIYTCTRPSGFPFPFPWQGFPPQKYSPSSPRFSDASEYENLFQNASKNLENSKKWLKVKTVSYYFSIGLNVITLFALLYFLSAGIISVDWHLPKFNFF